EWSTDRYLFGVRGLLRKSLLALAGLAAVYVFTGTLFKTVPGGFLPDEDQGVFISSVRLPDGASIERNEATSKKVNEVLRSTPGIHDTSIVGGLDIPTATNNSNVTT